MASYGPSFFLSFTAQTRSVQTMKTREENNIGPISCHTDQANEVIKMFIIWLC